MIHYAKVIDGIVTYIDHDMLSKLNGSWKAWGLGALIGILKARAPEVFGQLRDNSMVKTLGLIDGEMVDVDTIYKNLLEQAQKCTATVDLPFVGCVTYSASDVDQLYRCIIQ